MAATDSRVTALDFAKSRDPNGIQAEILEFMNQLSPVLEDATVSPSSAPYGNRTTIRRSLPVVGTAKLNRGVQRSKSAVDSRQDMIGFFSGRSEIDVRFKKVEGVAAYAAKRSSENKAFQEALVQLVTNAVFYGDVRGDEASFNGIATRLNALATGLTASQVVSMGSVSGSDGASLYIVDWGERACHLIFPPNTVAGLDTQDLGEIPVNDDDGNSYQAGVTLYEWFVGLAVEDPRHIARLANIDLSDAALDSPTQGKMYDKLEQIVSMMPDPGASRRVIYAPYRLFPGFLKQARTVSNLALSMGEYYGKPTPMFWGYPIRRSDQLSITEAAVS